MPDISSLSISEETNSGAGSAEKAIKLHDNTSKATTLMTTAVMTGLKKARA